MRFFLPEGYYPGIIQNDIPVGKWGGNPLGWRYEKKKFAPCLRARRLPSAEPGAGIQYARHARVYVAGIHDKIDHPLKRMNWIPAPR
jgi:hypothetical protein